ncbi:tetratricopeptide repeat protein [Aeromonas sp. R2-2]|uniref:tetratricopeptide repeat protein n=1 Tax=Aeromonas sp. R2-2 TaxID=3138460 RepID=UPI0034A407AD
MYRVIVTILISFIFQNFAIAEETTNATKNNLISAQNSDNGSVQGSEIKAQEPFNSYVDATYQLYILERINKLEIQQNGTAMNIPAWLMNQQNQVLSRVASLEENKASVERLHEAELLSVKATTKIENIEYWISIFLALAALVTLGGGYFAYNKTISSAKEAVNKWLKEPHNPIIEQIKEELRKKGDAELAKLLSDPEFLNRIQKAETTSVNNTESLQSLKHTVDRYNTAVIKFSQENYNETLKELEKLNINTSSQTELAIKTETLLAQTYFKLGNAEISNDIYEGLLAKNPLDKLGSVEKELLLKAIINYAISLNEQKLLSRSNETLKLIPLNSTEFPQIISKAYSLLSNNYVTSANFDSVVTLKQQADNYFCSLSETEKNKTVADFATVKLNTGVAYAQKGDKEQARKIFNELRSDYINSTHPELRTVTNKASLGLAKLRSD